MMRKMMLFYVVIVLLLTDMSDQPEAIIPDFTLCGTTIAEEAINQGKSPVIIYPLPVATM